jgi:hypothetical protein
MLGIKPGAPKLAPSLAQYLPDRAEDDRMNEDIRDIALSLQVELRRSCLTAVLQHLHETHRRLKEKEGRCPTSKRFLAR